MENQIELEIEWESKQEKYIERGTPNQFIKVHIDSWLYLLAPLLTLRVLLVMLVFFNLVPHTHLHLYLTEWESLQVPFAFHHSFLYSDMLKICIKWW